MGSIVVMCVRGVGHMHALLPVIAALSARGRSVHVLTHADHREQIERCGARFVDLFARYPIEAVDATSRPIPARYVTFAGVYAERVVDDVAALAPALVVYDTFSVVAPLVARRLRVPYVNVCPNHAPVPARVIAALRDDPRVAIAAECWDAVRRLQTVHGMGTASPFSYVEGLSPFLNLYTEPEEFLAPEDRPVFEPLAFFGSLAPDLHHPDPVDVFPRARRAQRILVSFGTLIWRYFAASAYATLGALSDALADLDADVVMSLGNQDLAPEARAALVRPNVQVLRYTDQWAALQTADVFVTHHGLNSTHEAIFHQVPMISCPFLGDQPALARRCQDLGLAVPLASTPGAAVIPADVRSALRRLHDDRDGFKTRLADARSWELRTIAARGAVIDRILALSAPF
jgi:MGT family glycosyltransferase